MKDFNYEDIKAATKGFSLEQQIGKGSHGIVYKGKLKDGTLVAVKKPLEGVQSLDDPKLSNEIDILSSINNSNVVNLIGVCHGPANKFLIMDFIPNGSLHDLLHLHPDPPTWPRRAVMAIQIARAILSLHEAKPPIIHRDIKSANILLDRNWNASLADFSLAVRDNSWQSPVSTVPAGTIGYLDPWYAESGQLGPKSDVFSFGVVLLELMSSRKVMDMDSDPSSIVAWAVPMIIGARRVAEVCDRRVALPDGMLRPIDRILSIAVRCVSENVGWRPLMGEVVDELERVVEGIWIWWPIWGPIRRRITDSVHRYVRAWRRRVKKRVTTTKIACKDHLIDGGNHDCSDDGMSPSGKA